MYHAVLDLFTEHAIQLVQGENTTSASNDAGVSAYGTLLSRQARILVEWAESLRQEEPGPDARPDFSVRELMKRRLHHVATASMSKFYAYRYDELPVAWRDMYADALVLMANLLVLDAAAAPGTLKSCVVDEIVALLDRVIITTCSGRRNHACCYDKMLLGLEDFWRLTQGDISDKRSKGGSEEATDIAYVEPQAKRRRVENAVMDSFPMNEPFGRPDVNDDRQCPVISGWSLDQFESMMNSRSTQPKPLVFTELMTGWPALAEHPWKSPKYLVSQTFGGRRLVPVEIGRSYVDDGWGQELVRFRDFLDRYILRDETGQSDNGKPVGYLAQHNLFDQIPSLRRDVLVPDYCWADVPPHPLGPTKDHPKLDAPQLNAWFGPAGTITPLHTDAFHNLLCQAVGTKYVRLYAPEFTPDLLPRGFEEGIDMGNTSALDLGVLEGWDEPSEGADAEVLARERQRVRDLPCWECVLRPGDTLLIPMGWWHYVRSLSVSFSVSFWWN